LIRLASKVEPEWLLDLFPERMASRDGVDWNRTAERVERVSALLFDGMVIEETRSGGPEAGAAAELLAAKALEAGMERFADVSGLLARWRFAGLPAPDLQQAISGACYGLRSFAELKGLLGDGGLERILLDGLADRAVLEAKAPERVKLAKGRSVAVHYVDGQPPWVASRLQDFFGMRETPRAGQTPVVVHLLAPNQRPVQVTQDLAGFWERHYPALRRELGRRYPRHAWPEDPLAG
jgi:ATP-dependent helicase HrpB